MNRAQQLTGSGFLNAELTEEALEHVVGGVNFRVKRDIGDGMGVQWGPSTFCDNRACILKEAKQACDIGTKVVAIGQFDEAGFLIPGTEELFPCGAR